MILGLSGMELSGTGLSLWLCAVLLPLFGRCTRCAHSVCGTCTVHVLRLFHRPTHLVYRAVHVSIGCKRYDHCVLHCGPLQYQPCPFHGFLRASLSPTPNQMVMECLPLSRCSDLPRAATQIQRRTWFLPCRGALLCTALSTLHHTAGQIATNQRSRGVNCNHSQGTSSYQQPCTSQQECLATMLKPPTMQKLATTIHKEPRITSTHLEATGNQQQPSRGHQEIAPTTRNWWQPSGS